MQTRRVLVGSREIHILEDAPEFESLTDAKAEIYRLLWALSFIYPGFRSDPYSIETRDFMKLLGLQSVLPLQSRFEGLEKLGKIRIQRIFKPESLAA